MRRLLRTLRSSFETGFSYVHSIQGEATFRQQFGEYGYLRQVMPELITFAMNRSASASVEQFFHDPLKRMPIPMNRTCFAGGAAAI